MSNPIHFGGTKSAVFLDMEAVNTSLPKSPFREKPIDDVQAKNMPWAIWGGDNLKPQQMADDIKKTASLTGIINLKAALALCEGMVPAIIKSDDQGKRIVDKIVEDPDITMFLEASNHFQQTEGLLKDCIGIGNVSVRFMANAAMDGIAAFERLDISRMRYEKRGTDGYVKNVYICNEWDKVMSEKDERVIKLPLLRSWAPWDHAMELIKAGQKEFVMTTRLADWNNVYYSTPLWYSAYKWVKIAQAIPEMKAAMLENMMRPGWIVTIYEGFWQRQFTDWDTITDPREKEMKKSAFFTEVDNKLAGKSNAGKNIYVEGELMREFGKAEAYIKFEPMPNASKDGENLSDSANANSEIAFAEMMNLALIGGNQAAGPYTKNEGGSNIREGSLFQVVISELQRKVVQHFMNVPKYVNGWHKTHPGLQFIIFATALTTLDTGAGSKPITTGGIQPKNDTGNGPN